MPRGEGNISPSGLVPAFCSARAAWMRAAILLGQRVAVRGAGGVDGLAALAALGRAGEQLAADLDHLAVHVDDAGGRVDLAGGQGEQLALPQPGVGRGVGHQLVQVPAPSGGQGLAEPGDVGGGGDLAGVDELRGLALHADLRAGCGPAGGLPVHFAQPRVGQVPAGDPGGDHG